MNQGAVRLSAKSLLRPLALPDSDNFIVESGADSQTSHHFSTPLSADFLLSPINPSVWKSASPHARFGIDIGGTLCKVVFFEPLDSVDSTFLLSSRFQNFSVDALLRQGASHVERKVADNFTSTTTAAEECFCSSKLLGFSQDPQESRKELSIESPSFGSGDGPQIQESCMQDVDKDCMSPSFSVVNRTVLRSNGIAHSISDSIKESAKYCKTGFKLWVSSHAPIILEGRGTLIFKCFETWRMEEFLFLTREHSLVTGQRALGATGGGARKFGPQFLEIADLQLSHFDELKCLVQGIDFLMNFAPNESFEYPKGAFQGGLIQRPLSSLEDSTNDIDEHCLEGDDLDSVHEVPNQTSSHQEELREAKVSGAVLCKGVCQSEGILEARKLYPYLVVNIGSGVSILLVESREQFKRVGGTSLGGSTFLGLVSALTGCISFKEAIDLAAEGDSTEIDMLVGDIYGGDYSEMGLAATTVASSFGKLVQPARRDAAAKSPQHLAKATLLMITNNIGSLAKLHAQATGVEHVLFTGSFMHGNKLAMKLLAVAMEFWSKGQIKAMFLRHGGHAGAMGALLNALDPCNQTDALLLS